MSEKGLARSAGPQAGTKTKLRIKRNKIAPSQSAGRPTIQSRNIARKWLANINKRIFSDILPPPESWGPAGVSPVSHASSGNDVARRDTGDQAAAPDVAAGVIPPSKRRKKACAAADVVPAAESLDQQQIAALQLLNSKLREKLQHSEETNAQLAQQIAHEKEHRETAVSKATALEDDVRILRQRLAAAEAKLQEQAEEAHEMKALHTAMSMRNPAAILSSREAYEEQRQTAERLFAGFEDAMLRTDADDPDEQQFNSAAAAVLSGLQASVLMVHAGSHEFQTGAERNSRSQITGGRGRIKQGEKWLSKVGQLTGRLKAAMDTPGTTLDKKERARRSIFTQGASVLEKRVHTLAEAEYLACERISVNQTTKHANQKQSQQLLLRERLKKQRSPDSDASCADVMVDPHMGTPTGTQVLELFEVANHFNQARKRLETTVDIAIGCVREGPRLSSDLLRFFKSVANVDIPELAQKGRAIGWTMAAVAGEFGMGFNANVGTLQRATEILRTMLPPPRSGRGAQKQAA